MNPLLRHVWVLAAFAATLSDSLAQGRTLPIKTDILTAITGALSAIDSVEFESTHTVTDTELSFLTRNEPVKENSGRTIGIKFHAKEGKYLYSNAHAEFDKSSVYSFEHAFDGTTYQNFTPRNAYLAYSKFDGTGNHLGLGIFSPLEIFGFLHSQIPDESPTIKWVALKNLSFWKKCIDSAQYRGVDNFKGKECVVLRIPGAKHKIFHTACNYVVYFSKQDGFFPVYWRAENVSGRILEDYQVDQLEKIAITPTVAFYYPRKATTRLYTKESKFPAGSPKATSINEVSVFRVNSIADDGIFTIDPMRAQQIVDTDRGIPILVRK